MMLVRKTIYFKKFKPSYVDKYFLEYKIVQQAEIFQQDFRRPNKTVGLRKDIT